MSITELEEHFEAMRQQAFADGYATAMKEVKELTARPAPDPDDTTSANGSAARLPRQGTNAVLVAEVLRSAAPRGLRPAEIRRALQDKGKTMSFPSIGYSLRQLAARNAARQIGNSKTWRYHEA